jgi:hypothetical protein
MIRIIILALMLSVAGCGGMTPGPENGHVTNGGE